MGVILKIQSAKNGIKVKQGSDKAMIVKLEIEGVMRSVSGY